MDTVGRPEEPRRDDLFFGTQRPAGPVGRRLARGVPLVTVGLLLGWGLHGVVVGDDPPVRDDLPAAAAVSSTRLVSGGVHGAVEPFGAEFVVSLHNPTAEPVEVLGVAPQGWAASSPRTTIPPDSWAELPLDADARCGNPPPGEGLAVTTASAGGPATQVVRMPGAPEALLEKYDRLCTLGAGEPPSRAQLTGVWLVERARDFAGTMIIDLAADGRFAMGPTGYVQGRPGAHGTFKLEGGSLILSTLGGRDCRRGDRARWDVGLRRDGRLHVRHRDYGDSVCSVEQGEVWVARRLLAGGPHRSWTFR